MLTVTEEAARLMKQIIDDRGPPYKVFRIVISEQGAELRLDTPDSHDTVFDHEGRTVLAVDERTSRRLGRRQLDVAPAL